MVITPLFISCLYAFAIKVENTRAWINKSIETQSKKGNEYMGLKVLILCTGNSARSQMAEGLLRQNGGLNYEVYSAGIEPSFVKPEAITVMQEIGIDISGHRSKSVDEFPRQEFDYVITVCDNAKEHCPIFPGQAKRLHWSFDDPATVEGDEATRLAVFARVRDSIEEKLNSFIAENHPA